MKNPAVNFSCRDMFLFCSVPFKILSANLNLTLAHSENCVVLISRSHLILISPQHRYNEVNISLINLIVLYNKMEWNNAFNHNRYKGTEKIDWDCWLLLGDKNRTMRLIFLDTIGSNNLVPLLRYTFTVVIVVIM